VRALIDCFNSAADRRQLVGASDADLCLGLQDSRCRNANIVILLEGRADQVSAWSNAGSA